MKERCKSEQYWDVKVAEIIDSINPKESLVIRIPIAPKFSRFSIFEGCRTSICDLLVQNLQPNSSVFCSARFKQGGLNNNVSYIELP